MIFFYQTIFMGLKWKDLLFLAIIIFLAINTLWSNDLRKITYSLGFNLCPLAFFMILISKQNGFCSISCQNQKSLMLPRTYHIQNGFSICIEKKTNLIANQGCRSLVYQNFESQCIEPLSNLKLQESNLLQPCTFLKANHRIWLLGGGSQILHVWVLKLTHKKLWLTTKSSWL